MATPVPPHLAKALQTEARKADKCRKESEASLKNLNKYHARLSSQGGVATKDEADKLRAHYLNALELSEREITYLGTTSQSVIDILEKRGASISHPPPAEPEVSVVPTHPLSPGTEVAARRADDSEWIQAKVVKWDSSKKKYELEDAEPDDADASFRLPQDLVFPLGKADITELPHGSAVLAVFPQTTTFYNAVIVTPPSKRTKREYVLVFDEDDWRGLAPARKVRAKLVLPHPD